MSMKRSICASGSGYVPSCSIGFCVAMTMNGDGQGIGLVADGDLTLLHRLEQRALHLGRRAVDLVGEHEVREDGAELRGELALLLVVDDRADDVGGQEVRRELDAGELGADRVAERAHRQRLGEAGHALEQHVAAGEQTDEDALDHVRLADDDLADLGEDPLDEGALAATSSFSARTSCMQNSGAASGRRTTTSDGGAQTPPQHPRRLGNSRR